MKLLFTALLVTFALFSQLSSSLSIPNPSDLGDHEINEKTRISVKCGHDNGKDTALDTKKHTTEGHGTAEDKNESAEDKKETVRLAKDYDRYVAEMMVRMKSDPNCCVYHLMGSKNMLR
ncbi:uncharacterized protein LOC117178786 [Belonocnema kinseyi]|uniref:uncharacterized protein LOC117178786 n=1 Tax=Belonocnema kinseyi TaxID=2817044 RepID=UPI00143D1E18|nr:uncharacterized protein LOC117178786 [Belonocnema kinseyi]